MRIFALIPAAGHSRRMGQPKLSLPLGGSTILERCVAALCEAGITRILVVVGPHVPELGDLAAQAGASVCRLEQPTPDMRATIEQGLNWLQRHEQPSPDDAWLLVPADHPCLDAAVVHHIIEAGRQHPECSIVVPACGGKRGHPALIGWKHAAGLASHPADQGLNTYLRLYPAETLEVPVESAAVLQDLDTWEDYQRLNEPR